ncbi:MAG: hypothetical protein ACTSQE_09140 [Candidatus Heimdallarchaeaceae archaeon]
MNEDISQVIELPSDEDARAKFCASIFGSFYEILIKVWLEEKYDTNNVMGKDIRKGTYKGEKIPIDYIIKSEHEGEYEGILAEAKCWSAYENGSLKILIDDDKKLKRIKEGSLNKFLNEDFLDKYKLDDEEFGNLKFTKKMLIWWDYKKEDEDIIKEKLGLTHLISIKRDILQNKSEKIKAVIENYKNWSNDLFKALS